MSRGCATASGRFEYGWGKELKQEIVK
jgi:hypothetical protein